MIGADFRTAAYLSQHLFLNSDPSLIKEYDLLVVYPMKRRNMAAISSLGGEDQVRLVNIGNWIRLEPLDRWPPWKLADRARRHWNFEEDVAWRCFRDDPDKFFTGGTFNNFGGEEGTLAALDSFGYFKHIAHSLYKFLRVWKALGYHGVMLEWGWFSEWRTWLLGPPEESVLDPIMTKNALLFWHRVLGMMCSLYGMKRVTQRVSYWSCHSDSMRLAFDGCKWEDPRKEVASFHGDEERWNHSHFCGPGWWKACGGDFKHSIFEIQRYPDQTDAEWEDTFREHVEAAKSVGAACCWYQTDREPWPEPSDYHRVLPRLPEFYRAQ